MRQNPQSDSHAGPELAVGSGEAKSILLNGTSFKNKLVYYYEIDGLGILEGDIILTDVERGVAQPPDAGTYWPAGIIPYIVRADLPKPERVKEAIEHWEARTRIRFKPLSRDIDEPMVWFTSSYRCGSVPGMLSRAGGQPIELTPDCTTGNVIHEIGHTVGLWHEQSREDRDQFVEINFENIRKGLEQNFTQRVGDVGDDLGDYDYDSIMHYPADAFSANRQPTIVPRGGVPISRIGQRNGLSEGDIAAVNSMYGT